MVNKKAPAGLGAEGFYFESNSLMYDAVSNLAVNIKSFNKKFTKKAVLFSGCGFATGATKIAVNVAIVMSRSDNKTLLIDADLRKGSMLENGLSDYFKSEININEIIRPTNLPDMDFAPSGLRIESPAMFLCSDKMAKFIELAKSRYDCVIINSPPVTSSQDAAALFMNADGIVLVCSLNETTKRQIERARNVVDPYLEKYYGMVVNSMPEKQYKKLFIRRDYRRR